MKTFRLRAPSPALVVSVLALVVALGGTSYAAFSLPNNSVGTKQLRNNAVTASKINPSALSSKFTQSSTAQTITGAAATIGSPIQIKTTGTKRVLASAAVHAVNGVVGTGVYLVCRITIGGNSGVNDTDYSSPAGGFTVVDASVSPLASAVVGPGTHTVTLLCSAAGGGAPQARVVDDALATWAVSG